MWKAAFTGRSETGSVSGRSSSQRKKSSGSSRKPEEESRKSGKSSRGSTYGDEDGTSTYATAPSSRAGEPRGLTESAVQMLNNDEDEGWEDEDRDARSERKSVKGERRKHRRRSEKERSRSRSRDKDEKRPSSRKNSEVSRGKPRAVDGEGERAIPEMGSFEQFPGQYSGGVMGPTGTQEPTMSGALPTPNNQFGLSRADSYGAAADYYQDEGQSVTYQPGNRVSTPNMLVNPDLHLHAASAEAQPAQDTGHGSAADFYSGKISPMLTAEPQPITPGRPSSGRPSKSGKTSSLGTAAAAAAAGAGLGAAASGANAYYQSQNSNPSNSYQQSTSSSSRPPFKPNRHNTDPLTSAPDGTYYAPPPQEGSNSGNTGKQSSQSNAGLYAAGAAAAGLAAYEINQHHQQQSNTPSVSPYGGTAYAQPPLGSQQRPYMNGNMQQHQHFHEHKGPMARLKDGLLNLISSEEDTIKMEMYTEYIGVCKYCFDPRTSPNDAPRRHHYHGPGKRDSFEELRRRKSVEKMRRSSRDQLGRTGSTRVDKDSRYYSDRRKSSSKADLVGTGLAVAGVAAGANALFNSDRRDFDDTYSVKSGHRESSAVRRRSRSSSRERRRRSSHGVIGKDSRDQYVTVRTKDGKIEKRRVQRSRSRSGDRRTSLMGAAAGAALGASAISAAGRSRRSREHSPNGTFVRRRSGSRSSSQEQGGGMFGGFFAPPRRKRRSSRPERQKKERGFFSFGNDSAASSDSELAFGASRTDLSLRRKSSNRSTGKRRNSDEHIAATVAGIGATAAALAAAQNGQRLGKRSSRPELGPGDGVKKRQIARKHGTQAPSEDEWEDELPSDVDDASSVGSGLAFGGDDVKLSRRQSRESVGSQSSGAGGLSAWGWRWGGKDKKNRRRDPQPPQYPQRPERSDFGAAATGIAAGALAGAALNSTGRPSREESTYVSSSSIPQQPLQYVDPRPLSDGGSLPDSRHASIPGAFDAPYTASARPGIAPLQQPKPVTPIKPAFTEDTRDYDDSRPAPRRTQSSPTQSNWGKDAALIGAAAVGTAAVIASQGRKSKDVRFGFTEEQERKHEEERRRSQQKADEERRRADRTRALKEEAARYSREQDVLRQRAEENKRVAEDRLERQRAEEQVETLRRREREQQDREDTYNREQARITEDIERKKRELVEQQTRDRDRKTSKRRQSEPREEETSKSASVPWGAVAAGAAAAGVGAVALAESERNKKEDRESRRADKGSREAYTAQEVTPPAAHEVGPITDDAFNDPNYFKRQRSRSPADYARHVDDLARKAADKVRSANSVLEDNEAYYTEPAQSQADFFAPEELSRSAEGKTEATDHIDDNTVNVYHAADLTTRKQFESEWGSTFAKPHSYAPRGVPKLDLITPTPPPEAMNKSRRRSTPVDQSRDEEAQADADAKKSARSRSISWGADQTHVYDVPTPDSHVEKESYIESHDLPATVGATAAGVAAAAAAGAALYEVVEPTSSTDQQDNGHYRGEDLVREAKDAAGRDKEEDVEVVNDRDPPPFPYRQPFYESVSDIGIGPFNVDSPGTEGAPPVHGFVEGEVADQTPTKEKVPHIPGGFDDDEEESRPEVDITPSQAAKEVPTAESASAEAAEWEPPLSKKDKKKREKAVKRSSTLNDITLPTEPVSADRHVPAQPEDDLDYYMSKKDKKKREKALKKGISEDSTAISTPEKPVVPTDEQERSTKDVEPEPEPEPAWEPPLSKKDKKKREKEAKKQGFADVAGAVMTAGGIAAVTSAMTDETSDASTPKKGKKGKKSRGGERDIRDVEPEESVLPEPAATSSAERKPSSMPGGWDNEGQEKEAESPSEVIDPFQFQIHDDPVPSTTTQETTPDDGFASAKMSKKSKRDSMKSSEPSVSSPLRSDVPVGRNVINDQSIDPPTNGDAAAADPMALEAAIVATKAAGEDRSGRTAEYPVDDRPLVESPRRVSPDDLRSVASDPTGDRKLRKETRNQGPSNGTPYYDEPDTYDDARSMAASEPVDPYEAARKTKRRSRREDDDTASVVSSRSRREKDESSSKDKKGGFFGMFSRRSTDTLPRSDGATLSRRSTKDSKEDEGDDGERRHRRRKHRSSEYGDDDDDDGRSVASESARKHRSRSERDEEDGERVRSSRYPDEEYESRNGDDTSRHHRRRRTDEGDYDVASERSSHRPHQRRRTDEEADDQGQSFLGMRVEDMPPLPDDDPREYMDSAPQEGEQGHGNLDSAGPEAHLASRDHAEAFDLIRQEDGLSHPFQTDEPSSSRNIGTNEKHLSWSKDVEYFPALPESTPGSPTNYFEADTEQRPTTLQRPTSTTAVPLRFPFGHQPVTPSPRMERAASFGGTLPSSPASPMSAQKSRQGRPGSTEIRPLYLVERNRKTPEVEEALPSLPSSKPSSRASSMVGSDEYESAAEDVGNSDRRRGLKIDTSHANHDWHDGDYLDSQQTTPRATHLPEPVYDRPVKQEPQFYTWEDYAQDVRMHETEAEPLGETAGESVAREARQDGGQEADLPPLPPSRPESRTESRKDTDTAMGVAAAAALGGAAVLGYHSLQHNDANARGPSSSREVDFETDDNKAASEGVMDVDSNDSTDTSARDASASGPSLARSSSSKKKSKKGKKGKTNVEVPVEEDVADPLPLSHASSRNTNDFLDEEELVEEGRSSGRFEQQQQTSVRHDTALDRFMTVEEQMESGGLGADVSREVPSGAEESADVETTRDDPMVESRPPEDLDTFMETEERMEAGAPTPYAEEAPSSATTRLADGSAPSNIEEDSWQPSRKLSKKEKRKQKAANTVTSEDVPAQDAGSTEEVDHRASDLAERDMSAGTEVPKTSQVPDILPPLTPSVSQGSTSLSNIFQGAADIDHSGQKGSPSTLSSTAAATVHTSMDPLESSASNRLSMSLHDPPAIASQLENEQQEHRSSEAIDESPRDVMEEDKPILQPEEEDPWESAPAVSRKKSKKDKKKRRSQTESESTPAMTDDERPLPVVRERTEPTSTVDLPTNAMELEPEAVPLPADDDLELDQTMRDVESVPNSTTQNEFGKVDTSSPAPHTSGDLDEPSRGLTETQPEGILEQPTDPQEEAAEFTWATSSKKKGKKGKKGKQMTFDEPTQQIPEARDLDLAALPKETLQSTADVLPSVEGDTAMGDDINAPVEPKEDPLADVSRPTEAEAPEFSWATTSSRKKGKKGKKSKGVPTEGDLTSDGAQSSQVEDLQPILSEQSKFSDPSRDVGMSETPVEAEPGDIWSTPTQAKNGKKSKKSQSLQTAAGADTFDDSTDTDRLKTTTVRGLPEEDAAIVKPTEAETTDAWSTPLKDKKGKKGKKSKRTTLDWSTPDEPADTAVNDSSMPEATADITEAGVSTAAERDALERMQADESTVQDDRTVAETWDAFGERPDSVGAGRDFAVPPPTAHLRDAMIEDPRPAGLVGERYEYQTNPSQDTESVGMNTRVPVVSPFSNERSALLDDASNTPLPDETDVEQLEDKPASGEQVAGFSNARQVSFDADAEDTAQAEPQRDVDFTADIADGLANSGFNPADFVDDPNFQRRISPPTMVAEADPEEFFAPASKKKKKGKKGKAESVAAEPEPIEGVQESSRFVDADETQTSAKSDFDETLEKTLAGTGFDTALLQRAASSSNDVSSNELTGDNAEFSFSVPKRKKGKKAKRGQTIDAEDMPAENVEESQVDRDTEMVEEGIPQDAVDTFTERQRSTAGDEGVASRPEDYVHSNSAQDELPGGTSADHTSHFAIAGDREMDVDEMDKAYKTFKKNKRNKKKQNSGTQTPAASRPTPERQESDMTRTADRQTEPDAADLYDNGDEPRSSTREDVNAPGLPGSFPSTLEQTTSSNLTSREDREAHIDERPSELPEYVTAATGLSVAAAAAAGLEHVVRRKRSGHQTSPGGVSPHGSERSLGLLPNDRSDHQGGPSWSFASLQEGSETVPESPLPGHKAHEIARDSGYQEADSPIMRRTSTNRTSQESPVVRGTVSHESLRSRRSAEPLHISTDTGYDWGLDVPKNRELPADSDSTDKLHVRTASRETDNTPLEPTTKNRASYLFQTTPETLKNLPSSAGSPNPREHARAADYFPSTSTDTHQDGATQRGETAIDRATFSPPPPSGTLSPRGTLDTIPEEQHAQKRARATPDAAQPDNTKAVRRTQTPQAMQGRERSLSSTNMPPLTIPAAAGRSVSNPLSTDELIHRLPWPSVDEDGGAVNIDRALTRKRSRHASADLRSASVMSNHSNVSAGQVRSPEDFRSYSRSSNRSSTPTLRRISLSGDLRAASRRGDAGSAVSAGARSSPKTIPFEPPPTPPSNDDEVMDGGASRSIDMSDVYQGVGDAQASQVSPTRPPNMRKRQSMHIMELESKLDQLAAENQVLHEAQQSRGFSSEDQDMDGTRDIQLQEKETEISRIRAMLEPMQEEISRLNEINAGLTEANRNLVDDGNGRYTELHQEHAHAHEQWQNTSRELEDMRQEHGRLNVGMREIVEAEVASRLVDKNAEIRQLREELDVASEKIRALQVQIQSTRGRDFLSNRDEDYFDGACQKLCQHVQQWVLRFSKMSDKLVCRLSTDLKDDKIEARLDNAILDGSDVDKLLGDRIKRRDVFMSVVMTMVWEYVFTRYLFGMDREQRQKLKTLEKLLAEVGPPRAVAQWRATTLTLLSKRPAFAEQKNLDTEAVSNEIFALLCALLPPPSSARDQLSTSLLKVIGIAVDLSVEMRTQRAEYIMLPPLQPEYDTNGDLVRKVHFNASLMNERSGMFSSNEELEESHAVVKVVLFPLVVKKGDESGEGEEEIVVCPAQVLVHNDNGKGKKIVRVQSGAMQIDDDPRTSRQSLVSAQGSMAF